MLSGDALQCGARSHVLACHLCTRDAFIRTLGPEHPAILRATPAPSRDSPPPTSRDTLIQSTRACVPTPQHARQPGVTRVQLDECRPSNTSRMRAACRGGARRQIPATAVAPNSGAVREHANVQGCARELRPVTRLRQSRETGCRMQRPPSTCPLIPRRKSHAWPF